ncbi:hypothetical protein SDRG_15230 [Saprolegnia diclina VS20]|uniref:Uncharacterized protein n=1 Tax=Saprolegnia diclina (strain VS20) TaxID=1156394 RepID=T0RBH7_SAPDV|nr:hypothetical protein SDRG_15230 [Saprolegnia diclina VS20]EQC26897.1 hypothetical protein SDRG_15230 [Saprolegnia diclina VS20]|eukprot:XP_008619618.1 hypothetical protein SDRG_15230 [Saprolegnia diclina VS20]
MEEAYQPWGSFGDLLHASKSHPTIKALLASPSFPTRWPAVLPKWFSTVYTMHGLPRESLLVTHRRPVWHNAHLPTPSKLKWLAHDNAVHVETLAVQGYTHVDSFQALGHTVTDLAEQLPRLFPVLQPPRRWIRLLAIAIILPRPGSSSSGLT